jgi:hypothetical protein
MKHPSATLLDIEIDKLTNSIENVVTGETFVTAVVPVLTTDLKTTTKKNGWRFDWRAEVRQPPRTVYKLVTISYPTVVQGLVSLENRGDHFYMHLIENAPANLGRNKVYQGVAGNLVAFACKLAFESGHQGSVSFVSKTVLIQHYVDTLGAVHFGGHLMVMMTGPALVLTQKYFKEFQP